MEKNRFRLMMLILLTGFLMGLFITNLQKDSLTAKDGILSSDLLFYMKYSKVETSALFCYILRERIKIVIILCVLSTTWLGMVASYTCSAWMGFSFGSLCMTSVIRYGLKGIILILAGIFPQCIVYFPAAFLLLSWSRELCRVLYYTADYHGDRNREIRKKALQYLALVVVVVIGCILESYVNPGIVKGLLKVF